VVDFVVLGVLTAEGVKADAEVPKRRMAEIIENFIVVILFDRQKPNLV